MANFTIPNRPSGSDDRHIADIEADFDYLSGNMDSMASKRQLLAQACIRVDTAVAAAQIALADGGVGVASGVNTTKAPVAWAADYGVSNGSGAQPTDFQISNKAAKCRLRVSVFNAGAAFNAVFGIVKITAVAGAGGNIQYTFATPGDVNTGAINWGLGIADIETSEFTLPNTAGTRYAFYESGTISSGAAFACMQLYGYNT